MQDISSYIYLLNLEGLVKKGKDYNFRCPVCKDSKKSKSKKRGWIFWSSEHNNYIYYCHNCLLSISFSNFLKNHYKDIFSDYVKENFKNKKKVKQPEEIVITPPKKKIITHEKLDLPTVYSLGSSHKAYQEIIRRKIPKKFLKYFYYSDRYFEWINTKIPGKFEKDDFDDPRIVIPFYTKDRKIFGVTGRSLKPFATLRYITIKFDEDHPKVFGLELMNPNKPIYVTEGQFDSLFLPNSIACGGADISKKYLLELANKDKFVFVMDNEPRNKEISQRIQKIIDAGFKICLLPYEMRKFGKDINDYVINGMTIKEIYDIINKNIYFGLKAQIKFKIWRKIK